MRATDLVRRTDVSGDFLREAGPRSESRRACHGRGRCGSPPSHGAVGRSPGRGRAPLRPSSLGCGSRSTRRLQSRPPSEDLPSAQVFGPVRRSAAAFAPSGPRAETTNAAGCTPGTRRLGWESPRRAVRSIDLPPDRPLDPAGPAPAALVRTMRTGFSDSLRAGPLSAAVAR